MDESVFEADSAETMFVGPVVTTVPSADERYKYKKRAGSSDARTTSDEFE